MLHQTIDTQIPAIKEMHRRRVDFMRARTRIELQAQSVIRRQIMATINADTPKLDDDAFFEKSKAEAGKVWQSIKKGTCTDYILQADIFPFVESMQPLIDTQKQIEKAMVKIVKTLPIYAWASEVKGLGEKSLAEIIGECGAPVGEYKSPSAVWKRMGLAVIGGERQRRVAGDAKKAIEHGYDARRRSIMWNIGGCLLKAQCRSEKDEKGKKIEGSEYSLGNYGQVYLDHKASLIERNEAGEFKEQALKIGGKNKLNAEGKLTKAHIHNRAQRYMEKRLLRDLWRAWRAMEV